MLAARRANMAIQPKPWSGVEAFALFLGSTDRVELGWALT